MDTHGDHVRRLISKDEAGWRKLGWTPTPDGQWMYDSGVRDSEAARDTQQSRLDTQDEQRRRTLPLWKKSALGML